MFCSLDSIACQVDFKEAFSVLMLCTPVFIFTSSSSALLGCQCCGLSIATCHIHYTVLNLYQFFSWENRQNMKILEVHHFQMKEKWLTMVTWASLSIHQISVQPATKKWIVSVQNSLFACTSTLFYKPVDVQWIFQARVANQSMQKAIFTGLV